MRFHIKYVIVGVIGLIGAILLFMGIKSFYYPRDTNHVELSNTPEHPEATTPSVNTDARSTPELAVPQQEIEGAIAFLKDLEKKESDDSVESQSTSLQPMGIRQRIKAFKESSKEYQELNEQSLLLMRRTNQLREEISQLEQEIRNTIPEFISIPSLPTEENIRDFERLKDRFPPEVVQKVQEMHRSTEERQDERKTLGQYLDELTEMRDHLVEELKSAGEQRSEVNAAIIDLLHRHGLPGTRAEVEEAVKREKK